MTATVEAPLPHWDTVPDDIGTATRRIKQALRERIARSGRSVEEVLEEIEHFLVAELADLEAARRRGAGVWPVLDSADLAGGSVDAATVALIKRRGCVVIRGTFERSQAEQWDREIVDYVERNRFFETYAGPGDDFFSSVDSKPEIYPIYWAPAQMEARQHPRLAMAQSFLNSLWEHDSEGRTWFDPQRTALYPDRIRRRPPGASSGGLGPHLDPGSIDLWMSAGYQRSFRHLFDGDFERYDPWDPAYRTDAVQYPASTMCSAFRTFQGWTALSDMRGDHGGLHTIPIPKAMGYLMLRPLLHDVHDDELCGVRLNYAFPVNATWHPLLADAAVPVPDVQPGDTVWWHCDLIHSVAPVTDQRGWANVMYIPAAPWCTKNERCASGVRRALAAGASPPDFPQEHYEAAWPDRFRLEDLNDIGRRAVGLDP